MARLIETITETQDYGPDCKTAEQMEQICCKPTSALQCCEVGGPWDGYSSDEVFEMLNLDLDNEGRDSQGRYVYIEFAPRQIACGEKLIDYDLTPGDCCDDVEPITIDPELTPDILKARFTVNVYWDGGRPPFTVTVSNSQTYFSNYKREIVTLSNWVEVSALESFCGATVITIADGCSVQSWALRSDIGQWEFKGQICLLDDALGGVVATNTYELVLGKWKQREIVYRRYWSAETRFCRPFDVISGLGCLGVDGADCDLLYCNDIAAYRPSDAKQNTCLKTSFADLDTGVSFYCELGDGAFTGPDPLSATTLYCQYVDMSFSGSTSKKQGYYLTTNMLYLYEWVC